MKLRHYARQVDGFAEEAESVGAGGLKLRNDRIVVRLALVEIFRKDHFAAVLLQLDVEGVDGAAAVVGVDGDVGPFLGALVVDGPLRKGLSDHGRVVASAEHPFVAHLGDFRSERDRRDERRLRSLRDVHHSQRAGASEVSDDCDDVLHSDELFHSGDSRGGDVGAVLDEKLNFVALDSAGVVDLVDGHFDAVERETSVIRDWPGGRHYDADLKRPGRNLRARKRRGHYDEHQC